MRAEEFYAEADHGSIGPLEGVRVVAVTKVWSGPMAACVLADLGADVVNVELPYGREGDVPPHIPGTSLSWFRESVHRNKRSVGLDLRQAEGREQFLRLVAQADLVLENYRPGTLDAWGVGYHACRAVRPDIVFVSVSGWGQFGPNRLRPAYDPVIQATSGWMALNGPPDGEPVRAPTFLADELAALHAAIGGLAALLHRARTGEGQHVDVSMMDAMLSGSSGLPTLAATGAPPARMGNETDFVVPSNVYRCRDGHVYLAVALNKHWRKLTEMIGRPDLARADGFATNEARLGRRDEINRVLAAWFADREVTGVVTELSEAGLVIAPVRTLAEAVRDPHLAARRTMTETTLSDGTSVPLVAPPAKFSRTPTGIRRAAPVVGADTDEVFGSLPGRRGNDEDEPPTGR